MPELPELNAELARGWSSARALRDLPEAWGWSDEQHLALFGELVAELEPVLAVDDTPGARRLAEVAYCDALALYRGGRVIAEFLLRHVDRSQGVLGRRIQPPKPNRGRLRRGWSQGQVSAYLRYLTNRSEEPSANMDPHAVVHVSLQLLELGREVFTGTFEHRWVLPPHLRLYEQHLVRQFEDIANRVDPHGRGEDGALLRASELAVQGLLALDPRFRSPLAVSLAFAHIGLVNRYRPMDDSDGSVARKIREQLERLEDSAQGVPEDFKRPLADASLENFACMARLHLTPPGGRSAERDAQFARMLESAAVEHDFAEDCLLLNAMAMFAYFLEQGADSTATYAEGLAAQLRGRPAAFLEAFWSHDFAPEAQAAVRAALTAQAPSAEAAG
jgi:hypothetical protein